MEDVKVENILNSNLNKAPNQFVIKSKNKTYFQSYESKIVLVEQTELGEKIYLDENKWNYSTTTGKYRNLFLSENINETRKKIKSGEYILTDLNKEN